MNELWEKVESFLPLVSKPGRYLGNEPHTVRKDPGEVEVRVVLAFPDAYDIGGNYLGFSILYHIVNRREEASAERAFAPWPDMEEEMRRRGIPLFSLESKRPLKEFDVVGFTLPYELTYTNILNMLDLAGIPILSEERGEDDPLVLGGGACAYNPEPLAPCLDAVVVGDGEEAIGEIIELLVRLKREGASRKEKLRALAQVPGVYVPSLYEARYEGGRFSGVRPKEEGVPEVVEARWAPLRPENYPPSPIVPLVEVAYDHLSVEVMRGCTRGCRFCNAGMVYRPLRERPVEEVLENIRRWVGATGWEEVSLLSLSTSDYGGLRELLEGANEFLVPQRVAVSLPSLRPDSFTEELAEAVGCVRKAGITFAPEAGTERLRRVINKDIKDEDLLRAVRVAYGRGWTTVKLYFMLGLPTEDMEDVEGIVKLVRRAARVAREHGRNRRLHISISPFSPKPNTPFQWEEMEDLASLGRKIAYLRRRLRGVPNLVLRWRKPEVTLLETVLARGDRRLWDVVRRAWEKGAKFDEWGEFFDFGRWEEAFRDAGIDPYREAGPREVDSPLPWDHIRPWVKKEFLAEERERGLKGTTTPDCRRSGCYLCGREACPPGLLLRGTSPRREEAAVRYGRRPRRSLASEPVLRSLLRVRYAKEGKARFLGHLDTVRTFERAVRRAKVPVAYSQGFHPRPRLSFGPPLPLGIESTVEYIDIHLSEPYPRDIVVALNRVLPEGFRALEARPMFGRTPSLSSAISLAVYSVELKGVVGLEELVRKFMEREHVSIRRRVRDEERTVDIRPGIKALVPGDGSLEMRVSVGKDDSPRPYEVLEALLGWPEERVRLTKVVRTGLFVELDGRLKTPMEVW